MNIKKNNFKKIDSILPIDTISKVFRNIVIISSLIFVVIVIGIISTILLYTASVYSYSDEYYDYYTINQSQVNASFALNVFCDVLIITISSILFFIYLKYVRGINKTLRNENIYEEFKKTFSLIIPIFILGIVTSTFNIIILSLYTYGPMEQLIYTLTNLFIVGFGGIALYVIIIVLFAKSISRRRDLERLFDNEKNR